MSAAPSGDQGRMLEFTKMHGAGNDFVVLDGITDELPPIEPIARGLADRRRGVGADQILVVRRSLDADFRMEIYNPDGSQVETCGNGLRALFKYLRDRGHTSADEIRVETLGGIVRPRWAGEDRVTVDMGLPVLEPAKIPTTLGAGDARVLNEELDVEGEPVRVCCVSMGNPHAVVWVEDVDTARVATLGPRIEHHPAFPNRVNVEFAAPLGRGRVRQRTWERGTGETLACGSGACAVVVTGILLESLDRSVSVELRGGELTIDWATDAAPVLMTGPAAEAFRGRVELHAIGR